VPGTEVIKTCTRCGGFLPDKEYDLEGRWRVVQHEYDDCIIDLRTRLDQLIEDLCKLGVI
jgi:hypothetical protein